MDICYASITFLLIVMFVEATHFRNFPWSNCWDEQKVYSALDECVSRSARDLSPRYYEARNDAREGRLNERLAYGRPPAFPVERTFFSGLFPTRGWTRLMCRNEFLTGTSGGVHSEFNFDTIKQNIGRVAIPGKVDDIQNAVDNCKKNAYESRNDMAFMKAMRYQSCFMDRLLNICRTRSPVLTTIKPTERPDVRTSGPATEASTGSDTNPATDVVTDAKVTPNCETDYGLDCF